VREDCATHDEGRRVIAPPQTGEPRINDRIRAREVRLVGADGSQIGIKPLPEALTIARELDLDLVEVADKANPPVCRIMDYGKYKYETAQRAKESRRKSSNVSIKEMKYRPKIGVGDFDTKTKKVARFLSEGHKVKVTLMFRGREMAHPELGKVVLDKVAETVAEVARVENMPRLDGRNMVMVLAPDKRAQQAHRREGESRTRSAAGDAVAVAVTPDSAPDTAATTAPAPSADAPVTEIATTTPPTNHNSEAQPTEPSAATPAPAASTDGAPAT
jgi:translation initiation factor IF-3